MSIQLTDFPIGSMSSLDQMMSVSRPLCQWSGVTGAVLRVRNEHFPYIVHYLYIHMPPVQKKCTTGNRALFATQSVLWVIRMMLTWLYQRGSWVEPGSEASWENPWRDARQYPLYHGLVGIGKELTVVCSFNGSLNVHHIYVWIWVIYLNIFCKYLALERG